MKLKDPYRYEIAIMIVPDIIPIPNQKKGKDRRILQAGSVCVKQSEHGERSPIMRIFFLWSLLKIRVE